jgi:hypothetical protein
LNSELNVNSTHLKESSWVTHTTLEPAISSHQKIQQAELNSLHNTDNLLRMEMSFIESNDLGFVVQRHISQVNVHHIRAANKMEDSVQESMNKLNKPDTSNLPVSLQLCKHLLLYRNMKN